MVTDRIAISLNRGAEDPEAVVIAYLTGIAALRGGGKAVIWLTGEAVALGLPGMAATIGLADAPSVEELHHEYITRGGRFLLCSVSVHLRQLQAGPWIDQAEIREPAELLDYLGPGGWMVEG